MPNLPDDAFFEHSPMASMVLDDTLHFVAANPAYCRAVCREKRDLIGNYVFDVFPDSAERVAFIKSVFSRTLAGEITKTEQQPYKLAMPDGRVEDRIWYVENHPVASRDGTRRFMIQYCTDITDREAMRIERDNVLSELNHRVRNMLSVVQSMATQTGRSTRHFGEFLEKFSGRLAAMGRNFNDLSESNFQGLPLAQVIRTEIYPHLGDETHRVHMAGPDIDLTIKATKDTAILAHELMTNAAKYGFLTTPKGMLSIQWRIEDAHLILDWLETGLTGISPPDALGFGYKLISMMPNITLDRRFENDGLKLYISIPLAIIQDVSKRP